jgi:hypothetical protein
MSSWLPAVLAELLRRDVEWSRSRDALTHEELMAAVRKDLAGESSEVD